MLERRKFLQSAAAIALTAIAPGVLGDSLRKLSTRRIPGTDERLAVIGLGNSNAFRQGDFDTSKRLLGTFFQHGGGYIDCAGDGAYLVASTAANLYHNEAAFLGSYFSGENSDESEASARRLMAIRGGRPLDLMHSYPEDGVPNWEVFRKWKDDGSRATSASHVIMSATTMR